MTEATIKMYLVADDSVNLPCRWLKQSGSSSITEQWFTAYFPMSVTCYNLRDSPVRDLNSSVYTVIHVRSHVNIR